MLRILAATCAGVLVLALLARGANAVVLSPFGDGSDGAFTYAASVTDTPIDSAASGSASSTALGASNASFAAGQRILIHQSRGTGAGNWEINEVAGYNHPAGTITTVNPLTNSYSSTGPTDRAQVLVIPEYTDLTVSAGVTVTAKAWNGTTGGIFATYANGTATLDGTIAGTAGGYRGGLNGTGIDSAGFQGEGTLGAGMATDLSNGNGAGGGRHLGTGSEGGGGGGNGASGIAAGGAGGLAGGTADLTTAVFGGGGGGGAVNNGTGTGGAGANGGLIVFLFTRNISVGGAGGAAANGTNGGGGVSSGGLIGGGGGGAGGSVLIRAEDAMVGTNRILATAGLGGLGAGGGQAGADGGAGRIRIEACNTGAGTTNPAASFGLPPSGCPSVGGIAQEADVAQLSAATTSDDRSTIYAVSSALGVIMLAAGGGWWLRRRRAGLHP